MIYVHYGHNYGDTPICNNVGKADVILPHGSGFTYEMKWCKECQTILQTIHGADKFLNIQLELPGILD